MEDIRGWINTYLTERFIGNSKELPIDECFTEAESILKYLRSQGVVIKGEENKIYPGWFRFEPLVRE